MSTYSILTGIVAVLLILFSVGQLVLCGFVLNYNSKSTNFLVTNPNLSFRMYWLPYVNLSRSYILQTVTAVFGLIVGVSVLGLSVWRKPFEFVGTGKRAPRSISWAAVSTVLATLVFCLAVPALVVSFYDSVHYGPTSVSSLPLCVLTHLTGTNVCNTVTLFHPFTIEGWTCQISRVYTSSFNTFGSNAKPIIRRTCNIAYISRWWTVPLLVIPVVLVTTTLLEIRSRNMARYEAQRDAATGLYPKEQSFSSAEPELNSPVSPIGTLPSYTVGTELHGRNRASAEMGGRLLMEAPEKPNYDELPSEKHQVLSELPATKSKVDVAKEEEQQPGNKS